jgi:ABC-type phosphate transport system substrate-binding protein
MRTVGLAILLAACLATGVLWPARLGAADAGVKVIVHPSRVEHLTKNDVRAIYLRQRRLWDNGAAIVPINLAAGSEARERFSEAVFGQGSRRLATYWNQRYFEEGGLPPATLASQEAVIRFVAGNENAIGYVTQETVGDAVKVALVLP